MNIALISEQYIQFSNQFFSVALLSTLQNTLVQRQRGYVSRRHLVRILLPAEFFMFYTIFL